MSFSKLLFPTFEPHDWMLWRDGAHDPAFNMAADHVLFDHAAQFGRPMLRLYTWDQPAVSFGRSQRYPQEIPRGFDVIRRPTGGGVVIHDRDCTYTLVLPAEHPLSKLEITESYQFIHLALLAQFDNSARLSDTKTSSDPLTMRCFDSPVLFDILDLDGTKCAGAAQLRRGGASLTQGSIRLSVTGGNHKVMEQRVLDAFEHAAHAQYVTWEPDAGFLSEVSERMSVQYATEGWNRRGELPENKGVGDRGERHNVASVQSSRFKVQSARDQRLAGDSFALPAWVLSLGVREKVGVEVGIGIEIEKIQQPGTRSQQLNDRKID